MKTFCCKAEYVRRGRASYECGKCHSDVSMELFLRIDADGRAESIKKQKGEIVKLSVKQKEVILFMRKSGREIFISQGSTSCGWRGESKLRITMPTFWKLNNMKLIEEGSVYREGNQATTYYRLSSRGQNVKIK